MTQTLHWLDHLVLVVYLGSMLALGLHLSRRQKSDEEYFLAGRRMPWFAVGISVIASLLSSLTYLSEPGEVWKSGITHVFGKMLAIPFEMLIVWLFCIPFMMRFQYTTAYEYLGDRFGNSARRFGVALFVLMVVLWMGFVVLASAKALAQVSGFSLLGVIATVGIVATIYTMLGGLRAVIWTDVVQVVLLIGGGLFTIGYVSVTTQSWLPDWFAATARHLQQSEQTHVAPLFSIDPFMRTTIVTVALHMFIWHVCTHVANQMTVQRYFSTKDLRAARRSFVTGSLFGVGINLMLTVVGLAVLYYYSGQGLALERGLDPETQRDLIFPTFAVDRLPPGVGGGILAALLAAAMSSIDSGVNSIATVLTKEWEASQAGSAAAQPNNDDHVSRARVITLAAGGFITVAAYSLSYLPEEWGIVGSMPRTFNAITAPLGGLFLVGIFMPRVGERAVLLAAAAGLLTSVSLGYYEALAGEVQSWGIPLDAKPISFTWIMPCPLLATFAVAALASAGQTAPPRNLDGLTWQSRNKNVKRP